jgi:hypothetical protein
MSETDDRMVEEMEEGFDFADLPDDLPYPLKKATQDEFTYALGTVSGMVFVFCLAKVEGDWMRLDGIRAVQGPKGFEPSFERGVYVRIADIEWCADSPFPNEEPGT